MIKVNGKEETYERQYLSDYLTKHNYRMDCIAVERNEEIVSKSQYDQIMIEDEDIIEIVNFVGGGSL